MDRREYLQKHKKLDLSLPKAERHTMLFSTDDMDDPRGRGNIPPEIEYQLSALAKTGELVVFGDNSKNWVLVLLVNGWSLKKREKKEIKITDYTADNPKTKSSIETTYLWQKHYGDEVVRRSK